MLKPVAGNASPAIEACEFQGFLRNPQRIHTLAPHTRAMPSVMTEGANVLRESQLSERLCHFSSLFPPVLTLEDLEAGRRGGEEK